jgi:hypothetical protein
MLDLLARAFAESAAIAVDWIDSDNVGDRIEAFLQVGDPAFLGHLGIYYSKQTHWIRGVEIRVFILIVDGLMQNV